MPTQRKNNILYLFNIILISILLFQTFNKALRPMGNDYTNFINSAEMLLQGDDPRNIIWPYPYFLPFAFIPFSFLPYGVGVLLWFSLNVIALYTVFHIVKKAFSRATQRTDYLSVFGVQSLVLLLMLPIIQNDLLNGQINLIILLLSLLFHKYLNTRNYLLSSVFLALAISLKVTPAILLFYVFVRREWSTLVFTILWMVLFSLLPYLFMKDRLFLAYQDYFYYLTSNRLQFQTTITHDLFLGFHDWVNVFVRNPISIWITWVLNFLWIVGLLLLDKYQKNHQIQLGDMWMLSLYLLSTLYISPLSEMHHMVLILPAVTLWMLFIMLYTPSLSIYHTITIITFWSLIFIGKFIKSGPYLSLSLLILSLIVVSIIYTEKIYNDRTPETKS